MIKKTQSFIELNGKRFNTKTGRPVMSSRPKANTESRSKATKTTPTTTRTITPKATNEIKTKSNKIQPTRMSSTARRLSKRTVSKSQTLMRQVVKRPSKKPTIHSRATVTSNATVSTKTPISKLSGKEIKLPGSHDFNRLKRASSTQRSNLVSKFGQSTKSKIKLKSTQPIKNNTKPQQSTTSNIARAITKAPSSTVLKKSSYNSTNTKQMLEEGLRSATSHKQTISKAQKKLAKKRLSKKMRVSGYTGLALAGFILTGLFIHKSLPTLSVRYAATKSGVHAMLPSYSPSGFSLSDKIEYDKGKVSLNFKSNSDDRTFTVTQEETDWNLDNLLKDFVLKETDQHQKFTSNNKTILLYGDDGATWIDKGIWYNISGDSKLNTEQLIKIANSLN